MTTLGLNTPQTEKVEGREDQVENNEGGFVFSVGPWGMLDRFLILGSEGNTYYSSERKITKDNVKNVEKLLHTDGVDVVRRVVEISESGRAPKNDQALYILAMASSSENPKVRKAALDALLKVARIGTHLFHYVSFVNEMRGWGRSLRKAVSNWYLETENNKLAYQLIKYQQRDGWSHSDVIRLAHPKPADPVKDALFAWIRDPKSLGNKEVNLPAQVQAFEAAKKASSSAEIIRLIGDFNLPRECIPTNFLTDPTVWEALLEKMPMTAVIRNLATMTSVGLLTSGSSAATKVSNQITDINLLRRARIHPISVLSALRTYENGKGIRGSKTWSPIKQVCDALDSSFYLSFGNVIPTGKRILVALDVSGSMAAGEIAGVPGLTPRDASAALALVTLSVEPNVEVVGFTNGSYGSYNSSGITPLNLQKGMRIKQAINSISNLPFAGTDCSLPAKWALKNNIEVDAFIILTDSETYSGTGHPHTVLEEYRKKKVIDAKNIVIGMVSNGFTIADPTCPHELDVVGFDQNCPSIISTFIKG